MGQICARVRIKNLSVYINIEKSNIKVSLTYLKCVPYTRNSILVLLCNKEFAEHSEYVNNNYNKLSYQIYIHTLTSILCNIHTFGQSHVCNRTL